jgi:O-antigen ligase
MKFGAIIEIFKERMAEANFLPIFISCFLALIALIFILWRWGPGFLVSLSIVFSILMMTRSVALGGIALMVRFPLVAVLSFYAILGQRNKRPISLVCIILAILPITMLLNSARATNSADAFGQGLVFVLFYMGLIIGGRKILGDARGRETYTKTLALFTIIMTCVQVPFFSSVSEKGTFIGCFQTGVGMMLLGTFGVIILVWFGMRQKVGSILFIFLMGFAGLTLIFTILSGGRTALGGVAAGILIVLSRKLKRNAIVLIGVSLLLVPVGLKIMTSFSSFERAKGKIFSQVSSGRTDLFARAFDEIKQRPLYGWGTGESAVKSHTETGMGYHNSYLEFGVDHGIFFGLLMLVIFAWFPLRGMLLMRSCHDEELKDMANLSTALLSAYFLASLVGGVLNSTTGILPIYATIALQEGVYGEHKEMKRLGIDDYYDYDYYDEDDYEEYSWEQNGEKLSNTLAM